MSASSCGFKSHLRHHLSSSTKAPVRASIEFPNGRSLIPFDSRGDSHGSISASEHGLHLVGRGGGRPRRFRARRSEPRCLPGGRGARESAPPAPAAAIAVASPPLPLSVLVTELNGCGPAAVLALVDRALVGLTSTRCFPRFEPPRRTTSSPPTVLDGREGASG